MSKRLIRPLATVLLCASMLGSLSGCVGLMIGGAVAGAAATVDRRTLGAQADDKAIAVKAEMRLPKITGPDVHINANSFNRRLLLTGEVKDQAMKEAVEREVATINGVSMVINELELAGPATYSSRTNDALITAKVKASLVDMKTITASSFKVITERGAVYLMGRVTQREGQVGADVARGVAGVQKVVKVFEYISEDELRAIAIRPSTPL